MQEPQRRSPYQGLIPYSEEDASFFFGREKETRLIIANLFAAPLTLLYGASGVGKSSILRAGVIHQLRQREDLLIVAFNAWQSDPLEGLKNVVANAATLVVDNFVPPPNSASLAEFFATCVARLNRRVMVILDQFEEYFLYRPQDDAFAVEFPKALTQTDLLVSFLISIREDSLAKLDRFEGRIPNLFDNYLRLDHLDGRAATDAIIKPLAEYNRLIAGPEGQIEIDPALPDKVIEQVRSGQVFIGETGRGQIKSAESSTIQIETPYLQLVMTRLWDEEMRVNSHNLRTETLNRLGGAERIVRTHLDAAMRSLSLKEQDIAGRVFRYLVTPSGTKIAYTTPDLSTYVDLPSKRLTPMLEKLSSGNVRILRPVASTSDQKELRYEIFHDVLAPAILDWRARHQRQVRTRQLQLLGAVLGIIMLCALSSLFFGLNSSAQLARSNQQVIDFSVGVLTSVPEPSSSGNATAQPTAAALRETAAAIATNVAPIQQFPATPTPVSTVLPLPTPTNTASATSRPLPTPTATNPPFPNDARILFVSNRENNVYNLYFLDVGTKNVRRLPGNLLREESRREPSYSKAQDRVVFVRRMGLGDNEKWNLFTVALDGQNLKQLTGETAGTFNNWDPAWSPNGRLIAFTTSRHGDHGELYLMNPDASNPRRLTNNPSADILPAWAPDNRRLVFTSDRNGNHHLFTVDIEVGEPSVKQLTSGSGVEIYPSWSPDGRFIVFRRIEKDTNADGKMDDSDLGNIWIMNSDGSNQHPLTSLSFVENHPVWSPDGNWIAFTRFTQYVNNNPVGREIILMTSDGRVQQNLTNNSSEDLEPTWISQ